MGEAQASPITFVSTMHAPPRGRHTEQPRRGGEGQQADCETINNSPEGAAYIRTGREPCLFAVTTIVSPEGAA